MKFAVTLSRTLAAVCLLLFCCSQAWRQRSKVNCKLTQL